MTNETNETISEWITDAPDEISVAEAEDDERRGVAWPISGDYTTIVHREGVTK